ncbi:innate immunity activator protein [Chanos chanos]|uniref:Innate immunity activator protein n=1 Tax=Chanos chanos TaxID=29144 RepID=A0A6J2WCE0_CHACN|nr:innate immunity activator protein [Chanos chanos]
MDCKEEISDSDSGIMLHSGPDSPTSPVKDLSTHTRAMRLKHQALEDKLELCLQELKKLCIREAELTGKLPLDYPLLPGEKPPEIRRRVGTAFKLDESFIQQDGQESELHALETDLALHQKIYEAARKLSLEEHLSKPVKKSRLQQCKREERKVKELQEAVLKHRINHGCVSPQTCHTSRQKDLFISDDSSLSDAAALDDEIESSPFSSTAVDSPSEDVFLPSGSPHCSPSHGPQQTSSSSSLEYERSPIQNSPWRESSLDQPYQKSKKSLSACSSRSSSPTGSPVDLRLSDIPPPPQFVFRSLAMCNNHSNSAPSTPELPVRRQFSQSFRLPKSKPDFGKLSNSDQNRGRARMPRRRAADFAVTSTAFSPRLLYQSSSEDSSSEHSMSSSYTGSPSREAKPCPPPYGYHLSAHHKVSAPLTAPNLRKNNSPQPATGPSRGPIPDQTTAETEMAKLQLGSPSPANLGTQNKHLGGEITSPKRILKPPPPYAGLVRTPSLREYPNHASRALPREVVSADLKSWHQRNNLQGFQPRSFERQGSIRIKRLPKEGPPPYDQIHPVRQGPQKVILQRAPDGTPLQWYEEENSEIISQV